MFTFLAIRYIDPKSILISSYMSLFKKLFTEKMFFIVVGTCVCVLVVFFTLGIIEGVVIESNGETRWAAWRNRLEEVNQVLNKEKVVLYTDTVQGEMFGFKDLMVIPVLELTRDSTGEHRKMLNFQMYDAARGIQCLLFQEHRHIFDSRMVKVKDAVLWIMESDTVCANIKLLGFVERTEQLAIMKNAQFIVQPSLCEGWGTVLEDAKVLNKVVLLSNIPVHQEQQNKKCVLFDPHDPKQLAETIARTAERASLPEHEAEYAGDMEQGIANMYREAREYSRALERVFL